MSAVAALPAQARCSFGGDEHLFVEISEEMSLPAFFRSLTLCTRLGERGVPGITEICPANASLLLRFDPDVIAPEAVLALLREVEAATDSAGATLRTRIIEMPVFYEDPWTRETLMRFRERHQDPSATDIEYAARLNGHGSVQEFIQAHAGAPWFVSMVGFVAGLPFLFQMVERARQIQVPKYLSPRTDTPALTLGYGGCFSCIYSVRGAGGYQMLGITPAPIFDPAQRLPYLRELMVFFRPGDIVSFKPIDRAEYDRLQAQAAAGELQLRMRPVTFSLDAFLADADECNRQLLEVLHGD